MSKVDEQVIVMPLAFAMIAMHSRKYRTAQVHGLLIGTSEGGKIFVCETVPICHETPTKSIIESAISVALSMIQTETSNKCVVGFYTVTELAGDDKPGAAALRIAPSLESLTAKPILVTVSKRGVENFTEAADGGFNKEHLTVYGKDFGMQWQERLFAVFRPWYSDEMNELRAYADDEQFCDLTEHWLSPSCSEWPKSYKIQSIAEKYSR